MMCLCYLKDLENMVWDVDCLITFMDVDFIQTLFYIHYNM